MYYYQVLWYSLSCKHRWFSGRMLACHAGGPGSIPGRCKPFRFSKIERNHLAITKNVFLILWITLFYEVTAKLPPNFKKPSNSLTPYEVHEWKKNLGQNVLGGAGYRSRYLSHAKRALYHLSYAPSIDNKSCILLTILAWLATLKVTQQQHSIVYTSDNLTLLLCILR